MKYSILGFNQELVVNYDIDELRCDMTDLMLLNYIIYANGNPKMQHTIIDDISYVWISHSHLLEDLPILNITAGTLKNRLVKLRKMNLLQSTTVCNNSGKGSKTFYSITETCYDLLYSASQNNDVENVPHNSKITRKELPHNSKITSNSKVDNLDKKVKTNSKELVEQSSSDDSFLGSVSKPKKKESLYSKCVAMIDDFIAKHNAGNNIRELLIQYLNLRLEMKDKPMYANQWKGILNKLESIHTQGFGYEPIIRYSLERGYASFFEPSKSNKPVGNKFVDNITKSEEPEKPMKLSKEGF